MGAVAADGGGSVGGCSAGGGAGGAGADGGGGERLTCGGTARGRGRGRAATETGDGRTAVRTATGTAIGAAAAISVATGRGRGGAKGLGTETAPTTEAAILDSGIGRACSRLPRSSNGGTSREIARPAAAETRPMALGKVGVIGENPWTATGLSSLST